MTPINRREVVLWWLWVFTASVLSWCTNQSQSDVSKLLATKAEVEVLRPWVIKLDYILDDKEYQFIIYKISNNSFQVRVNYHNYISELWRDDWENLKVQEDAIPWFSSSIVKYENERDFWMKLWRIIDRYVWTERWRIPSKSDQIYRLLLWDSKVSSTKQKIDSSNKLSSYRQKPVDLWYKEKHKEKNISWITAWFWDRNTMQWRILRCLRWKNITEAVEDRYGIPHGLLLAMMAQEWYGDPTLPNLWWDGGLWLIHIQATNAHHYGLNTLKRYNNWMRDTRHGKEINKVLKKENFDLRELIQHDDRFHPIMAVDVAARFLMDKKRQAERKWLSKRDKKNVWIFALKRYSWRGLSDYAYPVLKFWHALCAVTDYDMPKFSSDLRYPTSPKSIARLEESMDNMKLRIWWKSARYEDYLDYNYEHNYNYDLKKYQNIWKYPNT